LAQLLVETVLAPAESVTGNPQARLHLGARRADNVKEAKKLLVGALQRSAHGVKKLLAFKVRGANIQIGAVDLGIRREREVTALLSFHATRPASRHSQGEAEKLCVVPQLSECLPQF